MPVTRFAKALAAVSLFNGLLALTVSDSLLAANKVTEAKKNTEVLKTSKDPKARAKALEELGDLGRVMKSLVTDAMPTMIESLKDKDAGVRASAAAAVGKCDPEPAGPVVETLIDLLKNDKDESVKIGAAHGLGSLGSSAKPATSALREITQAEDKKSRLGRAAKDALKSINVKKA